MRTTKIAMRMRIARVMIILLIIAVQVHLLAVTEQEDRSLHR